MSDLQDTPDVGVEADNTEKNDRRTGEPIVSIRDLHKTYYSKERSGIFGGHKRAVEALQGVSLTIRDGSFVCVLGTNGSGKSTLLNAVAGTFITDSGKIILNGRNITRWPEHRRASGIGRVFQNPFSGTAPGMSFLVRLISLRS